VKYANSKKLRIEFAKGPSLPDSIPPPPPPPVIKPSKERLYAEISRLFQQTRCGNHTAVSCLRDLSQTEPLANAFFIFVNYYGYGMKENKIEGRRLAWEAVPYLQSTIYDYQPSYDPHAAKYAQYALAVCHYESLGGLTRDLIRYVSLLQMAVQAEYALAQNALGNAYYNGDGITSNRNEAAKLYQRAAAQGYADAHCNVGLCHLTGEGLRKDDTEAVRCYRIAAEKGVANAQYSLGWCYQYGRGVTKSVNEAVKWHRLAAAQDHEDAQAELKKLGY